MATIVATPGASNANSYETKAEADNYFANERLPLTPPWDDASDPEVALIMATRVLNSMATPHKTLVIRDAQRYYLTARQWTGAPASTTQKLAWPRTGMFDRNGNAIPSTVIPQELKDAQSELAGQLLGSDTTLDNTITVQGVSSVKAGSVSVAFKDNIATYTLPDAVWALLPPSWFTDELLTLVPNAEFDVL